MRTTNTNMENQDLLIALGTTPARTSDEVMQG